MKLNLFFQNYNMSKEEIKETYNKLTIIKELPPHVGNNRRIRRMLCKCDCGNISKVLYNNLRSGQVKTCGKCRYDTGTISGNWKFIKGFENLYMVTDTGEIWANTKKWSSTTGINREIPMIKMTQSPDRRGYLILGLRKDGIFINAKVHRLVAETFIPNPENKLEVNHKDGNKKNNNVSNLEWATRAENASHAKDLKLMKPLTGESHPAHKLKEKQVLAIRKNNNSIIKIAKKYNVSRQTIGAIKNRKIWAHI